MKNTITQLSDRYARSKHICIPFMNAKFIPKAHARRFGSSFSGQQLPATILQRPRQFHAPVLRRREVVRAAIFGVGAPEALLVGVVALVVFGPKGLAQAVKSLGATLRTFSPTIRELASVTNELSSTLQEQIGLDDIRNEFRNPPPNYYRGSQDDATDTTAKSTTGTSPSKTDEGKDAKDLPTEDLQAKIEESKRLAWGQQVPETGKSDEAGVTNKADVDSKAEKDKLPQTKSQTIDKPSSKSASDLSIDELEAELARRRKAASSSKL